MVWPAISQPFCWMNCLANYRSIPMAVAPNTNASWTPNVRQVYRYEPQMVIQTKSSTAVLRLITEADKIPIRQMRKYLLTNLSLWNICPKITFLPNLLLPSSLIHDKCSDNYHPSTKEQHSNVADTRSQPTETGRFWPIR